MDPQTRWAVQQIQKYLREGNAAAVVEIGERVLSRREDDLEVFMITSFCLAAGYERLGLWERALARFDDCLVIDPDNPSLLAGRARVLLKMGKAATAAVHFERLARRHADRADLHLAAGVALVRTGRVSEALGYLNHALEIDRDNPFILNELGLALLLTGELEAALERFKQAVERMGSDDLELARDVRENLEEVRAAMALRDRAAGGFATARVLDLHDGGAPDSRPSGEEVPTPAAAESKIRSLLLESLRERGCRARQIVAALHLWSDFLDVLPENESARLDRKAGHWAAAVCYAIGRLDGEPWARQRVLAADYGISISALSRRFAKLCRALAIEVGDPRYSSISADKRAFLIEEIRAGRTSPDCLLLRSERESLRGKKSQRSRGSAPRDRSGRE